MMCRVLICSLMVLQCAGLMIGGEKNGKKAAVSPLDKAFSKLKSLAGTWKVVKAPKGIPKSKVVYKVTANGSAVIETLFPGTKMEMVSVYHRDGKKLLMTHYCAAQNQPRFTARVDKKTGDLILDFAGGTNLNPKKDMHIHGGRIHFIDNDNISSDWMFYINGKRGGSHAFTIQRVK